MCHTEVNLRSCLSYSVLNWLVLPAALHCPLLCFARLPTPCIMYTNILWQGRRREQHFARWSVGALGRVAAGGGGEGE
jgi:hypothetical protein